MRNNNWLLVRIILVFNAPIIYTWNIVERVYLHTTDYTRNKIWFYLEKKNDKYLAW